MLEATLFWQQDEAIAQTQYGEWSASSQAKILAKLLRDGQLALFADTGGGQVFESGILGCHGR
jgi:hypothetical protein